LHIVSADEMRALDRHTIERIGIPAAVLMENAGREVARKVQSLSKKLFPEKRTCRWVMLIGKGNNGGDGLVAARHLALAGIQTDIVFADPPELIRDEAALQRDIAANLGFPFIVFRKQEIHWHRYDGIVDALLGTGTAGPPREHYAALIREANASGLPIVAVDIPSGLNADTGAVYEPCIRAVCTVTFAFVKRGLTQYPGAGIAGEIVCAPIGIPEQLADSFGVKTFALTEPVLREKLGVDPALPRRADTHKGTYGHALIVAGSLRMSGAALLAASAALRAGSGLVTLAVPERLVEPLIGRCPELMLAGIPDGGTGEWPELAPSSGASSPSAAVTGAGEKLLALTRGKQSVLLGPGMGRFPGDTRWLRAVWEQAAIPLVLDADALNMLAAADDFPSWPRRQAPTIFTPHPGEMARLAGISSGEVQSDRIGLARRYALRHGVTLVLKGARTVIASPEGTVYINGNGNPGMAKGGAGDVLAGMIAGLLAQGLNAEQAAALGVFLHGAAGDRAASRRHMAGSLLASEILDML